MAESKPLLCTYFRSQIAISESRFAVEQSSFRNGSAIRTEVDRSIAINLKFTLPL